MDKCLSISPYHFYTNLDNQIGKCQFTFDSVDGWFILNGDERSSQLGQVEDNQHCADDGPD
jgi:hypothetical protein